MAKFEELEEVHAELKLKQALWNSLVEWDVVTDEWLEVGVYYPAFFLLKCH